MTWNWGEWLTHQRLVQPSRGIWTGWVRADRSLTKFKKKCTPPAKEQPQARAGGQQTGKQLSRKGLGLTPSWPWDSHITLTLRLTVFLATLGKVPPTDQERWSFCSNQHWQSSTWSTGPNFGLPRELWTYWRQSRGGPPRRRGTPPTSSSWRKLQLFSLEKRLRGDLPDVYKYQEGGHKRMDPGCFHLCQGRSTEGFLWISGGTCMLCKWQSTGTGCPEKPCGFSFLRSSNTT